MHDFFEGVCPYDLSAILLHYLNTKLFSIEDINYRIMAFNYGPIGKGNGICHI